MIESQTGHEQWLGFPRAAGGHIAAGQRFCQVPDLPAVDLCHVRVQIGPRAFCALDLSREICPPTLEFDHSVFDPIWG
jgi:hypothetical protein